MGALEPSPALWASGFVILLSAGLGAYSWLRRREPGALPFAIACALGVLFGVGSMVEALASSPDAAAGWVLFQAICLVSCRWRRRGSSCASPAGATG